MNAIALSVSEVISNYKDWVRRNPQTASEVETTVKWLSYFVAGKINKSVVLTELVYSSSNLLVLLNDLIIKSSKQKISNCNDKIKIWLTVLEYSEVFIEISSKSLWGEKGKWVVIICVQLLKCAARLILLLNYKEKILSCPPVLPSKRNQDKGDGTNKGPDGIPRINNIAFSLKRSGRVIRKVDSELEEQLCLYLYIHLVTFMTTNKSAVTQERCAEIVMAILENTVAPPLNSRLWKPPAMTSYSQNYCTEEQPDKALLQQHLFGEVLYIVKPVVNLGFVLRYGHCSWKPWTLSAAMDLISLYLLLSKPKNQTGTKFTPSQRLELSRRQLLLLLYLMRSPFYEKHSKRRINNLLNGLSRNLPLAKLICTPIQQYLPHWQETYFYLWSS